MILLIFLIIVRVLEWESIAPKFQTHLTASLYLLHFNWRYKQYAKTTPLHLIGVLPRLLVSTNVMVLELKIPEMGILWSTINTAVELSSLSNENNSAAPETGCFAWSRAPCIFRGAIKATVDRYLSNNIRGMNWDNVTIFILVKIDLYFKFERWRAYDYLFTRLKRINEPCT